MKMCVPCPPHRKTVGSFRTFILIPEGIVLVRIPIAVFDSHCKTQNTVLNHTLVGSEAHCVNRPLLSVE